MYLMIAKIRPLRPVNTGFLGQKTSIAPNPPKKTKTRQSLTGLIAKQEIFRRQRPAYRGFIMRKTGAKKTGALTEIPGVGKSIAQDLHNIGIQTVSDLKGKNPETLFALSNDFEGRVQDRCLSMSSGARSITPTAAGTRKN